MKWATLDEKLDVIITEEEIGREKLCYYYDILESVSMGILILDNGFVICRDGIIEISGEYGEDIELIEMWIMEL